MQIIWNSLTRAELLKFVDNQRANQGPDGCYEMTELHSFSYQALSKELCVGNVYLRVYNNQPDYEITEAENFCVSLLKFVSDLVHNLSHLKSNIHKRPDPNNALNEPSNVHNGQISEEASDDGFLFSSIDDKTKEELGKNLKVGLIALQVYQFYSSSRDDLQV